MIRYQNKNRQFGWLMVFIMLLVVIVASCSKDISDSDKRQTIKALANYNTNQFLLDRLRENRVLFIGDFGHPVYLYKRTVTDLLNHWMDQVEAGADMIPKKLFLILETDSIEADRIRVTNGNLDIDAWLDESRPGTLNLNTADFQFLYHDVRTVLRRVKGYNAGTSDDSVSLEVVGPERGKDLEKWSFVKRDSFFVYDRDQYSSTKIIELLEANPDYDAIVFYGATHMLRGEQRKRLGTVEDKGYFLGHFLAERFEADGGLCRVYQGITKSFRGPNAFIMSPGKSYAIDNESIDKSWFTIESDGPNWFDVCDCSIVHFKPIVHHPPLSTIRSQRIVNGLLKDIERCEDGEYDYFKALWQMADKRLRVIAGIDRDRDDALAYSEWAKWYDSTRLNLVNDISSLRLWTRLVDRMEAADTGTAYWYDSLVSLSLRGTTYKDTTKTLDEKVEAYREYLELYGDVVIIENLVNLLLVGTDEEIAKALPILRDSTGQDFATPWEWADWFRGSGLVYHPY